MNQDEHAFFVDSQWTWRDRVRAKLFPSQYCELPNAPGEFKDCIVMKIGVGFSFVDRLRVLLSGKVNIEAKIVCENAVGTNIASSVAYPVLSH